MHGKLLFLLLVIGTGGYAQDDGLKSPFEPSLGLAVPVRQDGERVVVTQKFLLNDNVIIRPGDQFRVIFTRPEVADSDVRMKNSKQRLEGTFSRQPTKIPGEENDPAQSSLYRAAYDRATKTVWRDAMLARAHLDRMNLDTGILVFQPTTGNELIVDVFSFPQDLFLGETDSRVVVLAVRKDSEAQKLGIVADDVITVMNGKPLAGLEDFRDRFFKEKQELARQSQPVTFTVVRAGETKEITFRRPRSLTDNPLMSDF